MNEQNIVAERTLRTTIGDWQVHLFFRWEGDGWVCRMANDFMEELIEKQESEE